MARRKPRKQRARFVLSLAEAERRLGLEKSSFRYLVVDDSKEHALAARWRVEGIQFLLQTTQILDGGSMP